MNNKRFLTNIAFIIIAAVIVVTVMVAMIQRKIGYTMGVVVIVVSMIICCLGLALVNYRFSAYGKQFRSRYPDSSKK